ncbi:sialic acid-binding Ig-like lectin 14 [Poecilia reticulata]|uniref:sialic acid-binding Ig-like lectin 14 n=1 Tax=Poecilia reticulata TaxID=8081 RepID=UPI0004A2E310|nr:PREDICTED: sialic acid-binding Ig-like lectin 14 [Poecilia reticulata]
MFVFIWLIVSLPSNNDALQWKETCEKAGYCVAFNEGEIRAEAGLCSVIPCAFTVLFAPARIIWYKCDNDRCYHPEIIFHSDKNKENIKAGFEGRVSLMEPDLAQKNCGIIINDLNVSDSGSYQVRVEGNETKDVFTYKEKTTLSVTGLNQTLSVMVPLTEGQQVTLTCTAPGLCSGSPPNITWIWRGKGRKDSFIKGNITALKTENLTAVTKRYSSTLTFNTSADHNNTNIICNVSFPGNITRVESVFLNISSQEKRDSAMVVIPWVITGISFSVHVSCMIYICYLCKTREIPKFTEDQTYRSLQKHDTSAKYVQRPG